MKKIITYTDGAARSNPGPGGWGVVLATTNKDSQDEFEQVTELGGSFDETTNNQAELTAVIQALQWVKEQGIDAAVVYTDSSYLIQGITSWRHNWQKNGWETKSGDAVKNKKLWQDLIAVQEGLRVGYEHVEGHAGIPANERADDIATAFADQEDIKLFSGPAKDYNISLAPESQKLQNPPVYLSFVNGDVRQHETWNKCKDRVEGVQAQYQKIETIPERDKLLAEWGKTPEDIIR